MEYIKKEELKEGEIYTHTNGNIVKYETLNSFNKVCGIHIGGNKNNLNYNNGNFTIKELKLATSEEKHWLNECIKLDKFITFEEAIKSFIPEYVECIKQLIGSKYELGIIYKVSNIGRIENNNSWAFYKHNQDRFKPSTKEAYDAQFVVKEPEFVLPERWCVEIKENSKENICNWFQKNCQNNYNGSYKDILKNGEYIHYPVNSSINSHRGFEIGKIYNNYIEITIEQFKKYVLKDETTIEFGNKIDKEIIEPLPQFKVIETIETITKVENNEGNQFFIGDVVKSSNGTVQTIESFDYNKAKTNIIAFTNKQSILGNGIGIDKIEHYIEPKTDYKILEYKTEGGISCKAPFLTDSHQFYINERCKIYSIKRISDDLIITVGDEVLSKTCGVPNKILSIELINNKIRLYPRNSFYNLEDIIKVKEETLLEKAKRLYPIGTKFIPVMRSSNIPDISIGEFRENNGNIFHRKDGVSIFFENKWAEIIK